MIEFRHIRYFIAVAETLNFGRAAKHLHISQPPLTRQIQQLEAHLGTALFHRFGRRIALTDAGAQFLDDTKKLVADLKRAEAATSRAARGEIGQIRIGFVSTALYSILPALVRKLREKYPRIEVDLRELTADVQCRTLERDEIDAGIVICPDRVAGMQQLQLYEERLIVCLPSDHELARRRTRTAVTASALRDETFILFPRDLSPGLFGRIVGLAESAGFQLRGGQ